MILFFFLPYAIGTDTAYEAARYLMASGKHDGNTDYFFAAAQEQFVRDAGWNGPDLSRLGSPVYLEREEASHELAKLSGYKAHQMLWWAMQSNDSEIVNRASLILYNQYLCRICEGTGHCIIQHENDRDCKFCISRLYDNFGELYTYDDPICVNCVGQGTPHLYWILNRFFWDFD